MDFNFKDSIILENDRSRLSPLSWEHFEPLLEIALRYPDLLKLSPSKFGTKEDLQAYFEAALTNKTKAIRYPFVIFDKKENAFAGSTSFGNISNQNQRIEIGWTWIGKHFQRTGLNRNNKFLMLQYAFETLEFERVELKTDSRNMQSRKAMEGIGATYEGLLRSHTVMSDGYRRNTVYYSILKPEWTTIKERIFRGY